MSKRKLILINTAVGIGILGCAFVSTMTYDLFFSKRSSNNYQKENEFTKLSQVLQEDSFPEEISSFYYPDYGFNFFGLNEKIFPINGRSNIKTYYCEEQGYLSSYKSDRYGFNNPDNVYNSKSIDIALIGDSYVDGACTNDYTFRNNLDDLSNNSLSVANFALGGSGPLLQYAFLKEFALYYQPKKILWFWCVNDLRNLQDELNSPLRSYMVKDFTQNLIEPQNKEKADLILKEYFQWIKKLKRSNFETDPTLYDLKVSISMRFPLTYSIYKKVKRFIPQFYFDTPDYWNKKTILSRNDILTRKLPPSEYEQMVDVYSQVMKEVKETVSQWNGEVTIVFIGTGGYNSKPHVPREFLSKSHKFQRKMVEDVAIKNGFKFFDFEEKIDETFSAKDHVKGFSRGRGHFTDKGYKKASKILFSNLLEN